MRLVSNNASHSARLGGVLAAMTLVVAGCGDDDGDTTADDGEAPPFLTMATGSTGGTYFPLGGAMAQIWSNEIDGLRVSTQATGASVENLRLLAAEEVDLIMAVNGVAATALAGEGDFAGEDHDITFLGNVYGEVNQIVARADAGISTIEDLEGKRVALGPAGSGTEVFARALLERAGIDPDSGIEAFSDTFGDAADRLRDGSIDASFAILALPAGSIEEVATSTDLVLVSLEGDLLEQTLADDPTLSPIDVPAGTYDNIDTPATVVSNWATLYARSTLPEDTAFELVRVLYENNADIAAAHAVGEQIQLDTALDAQADIPLHPGAERYYQEAGAL
jgi:uncharacterized protein